MSNARAGLSSGPTAVTALLHDITGNTLPYRAYEHWERLYCIVNHPESETRETCNYCTSIGGRSMHHANNHKGVIYHNAAMHNR
jgi:hypothetical protein